MDLTPRNATVILKDWMKNTSGGNVAGVYGKVTVQTAKDAVGFDTHERESNWFAYVEGSKDAMVVLGCQIRAIHFSDTVPEHSDILVIR